MTGDTYNFSPMVYDTATLHVATGGLEAAKKVEPWKSFKNIVEGESDIIDVQISNPSEIDYSNPYEVYNISGVKIGKCIEGLPSGVYILRQNTKTLKIAVL